MIVSVSLTPQDYPRPVSRAYLLPEYSESIPGNRVQMFLRCFMEQDTFFGQAESQRREKWREMPLKDLPGRVEEVARTLLKKNPVALKATKDAVRRVGEMTYDNAEDFLVRAQEAANSYDNDGRKEGIKQFIDDKTFKPGLSAYDRSKTR